MSAGAVAIDFASDLVAESREIRSDDGTVNLQWSDPGEGRRIELQQAGASTFADPVSRYTGAETGSVVTGLAEGDHYFRIRAVSGSDDPQPWSEPLHVRVEFMPRERLFLLLATGGGVVILTVGAILTGHLQSKKTS